MTHWAILTGEYPPQPGGVSDYTRLVARGIGTDEIAGRLFLSRHTVRDHLKAIFEKVGVSSRGELTSKLFAEHYQPQMDESLRESFDRVAERAAA